MLDATSLLFDLPGFEVVSVQLTPLGVRQVLIRQEAAEHACPTCGVLVDGKPYDVRPPMRIKDLPFGDRPLLVVWAKRRYRCQEVACPQKVFVERSGQLPPRRRITARLRARLELAVSGSGRSVADVAREYRVSWDSVHRALIDRALALQDRPLPAVRMLGLDETRTRSVRWRQVLHDPDGRGARLVWRPADPWMTSFVDLDAGRPGWLLGLVSGRSGQAVIAWLSAQPQEWRDGIEVVALDPSAPFAAAVRRLLPQARIVVDHWHLVRLGNEMLTEVRRRCAQQHHGRRGGKNDPAWVNRRLLLTAGERLSPRQLERLQKTLRADDPTNEISAAWAVKERLRQLLRAEPGHDARHALHRFYETVLTADLAEATRLARTIETWWPAIQAFLELRVTNARTEGTNRVIKQIKRVGCGYRNQTNYERRIVLHVAARSAA